jgi:hypothetical protein
MAKKKKRPEPRAVVHLEELIAAAARDRRIRDALVLGTAESIRTTSNQPLDAEDRRVIDAIREDLLRFGGNPDLHPDDARSWALGVLIAGTARTQKDQWVVRVESIQRSKSEKPVAPDSSGGGSSTRRGRGT